MLCVGQPVTDPTTADFLNYYAAQAKSFTHEQIGITSADLRAMPLTRDHTYAQQRLAYFAGLAQIQQNLDTGKDVSTDERLELAAGIEAFARSVTYVDYAPSLQDALAMCMTGFPNFDNATGHRRQLVYLGAGRTAQRRQTWAPLATLQQPTMRRWEPGDRKHAGNGVAA
jgi:hypothetical protein